MIKRLAIALVAVILICGGLVGFNLFRSKMIANYFATMKMPAATISATVVQQVSWAPQIAAIGTLNAIHGVDVAVQSAGIVQSIGFKANDVVKAGQLLVQLDDAVERADLSAGQAALARDRAALNRSTTLSQRGVSSEATLETAQTTLAASSSALARTQATIDLKSIEAPFAGTIGIPRIEVGQYVQPGTVIATLQQLDTMRVDFTVPEQLVGELSLGQQASFGLTETEFPFTGKLIGIDPKIDPQTRLVSVRAEVENAGLTLRPGQFVRVRVGLPPVPNVIALPQTSVVTSLYGDYVYLVDKPADPPPAAGAAAPATPAAAAGAAPALVAKQVFVEVGRRQGNEVEIRKGVTAGDTVVTSGQNKLSNNMPVVVDNTVDPAKIAANTSAQP